VSLGYSCALKGNGILFY